MRMFCLPDLESLYMFVSLMFCVVRGPVDEDHKEDHSGRKRSRRLCKCVFRTLFILLMMSFVVSTFQSAALNADQNSPVMASMDWLCRSFEFVSGRLVHVKQQLSEGHCYLLIVLN